MKNILADIVAQKQLEIKVLYQQYDLNDLRRRTPSGQRNFYTALREARSAREPFFIAEFKRKSPSEGWIAQNADVAQQVERYREAGAQAVSVLTDEPFFGGSYADLRRAAETLDRLPAGAERPLLLQKDFVLDPIQVYLARQHGADIILLIAAILDPARLVFLKNTAESLGMGVLVEVHDRAELEKVSPLDFPVLGVNNRDLATFRTALNRVNALAPLVGGRLLVAESGVKDYRDFQVVKNADAFLIGAGLMQAFSGGSFRDHFQTGGRLLFKACGIRTADLLNDCPADYAGVNFSPLSKRRIATETLDSTPLPARAVAVFFQNSEAEIRAVLEKYPFRIVQLYADDTTPEFVRSLRQKVWLACRVRETTDLQALERFAADVDLFILDGAQPGSGQPIESAIPSDFPYPFLLAGGIDAENADRVAAYDNCIGIDVASGIETDGTADRQKIVRLAHRLQTLNHTLIH